MHTAYCHRNLKLCLRCDEPFLTSVYEEHVKTIHSNISCDDCSEKLEAKDLESHKVCKIYIGRFFNSLILVLIFVILFS